VSSNSLRGKQMDSPVIIQFSPYSEAFEVELKQRGKVLRWFELNQAEQSAALEAHAPEIIALATNGHWGCPKDLIEKLPALKLIAINGVGFDKVDRKLCTSKSITVTTTPDLLTEDVADLALGMMLAKLRQIHAADSYVRAGKWLEGEMTLARKASGRCYGILGLGNIGAALARRLAPLGEVHYHSRSQKDCPYQWHNSLVKLATAVDVLFVTCAATAENHHMINTQVLQSLGKEAGRSGWIINVARGSIIDEQALIAALQNNIIAGAALDVFPDEPRVNPILISDSRVLLSPHIASATEETRKAMANLVLANIDAAIQGTTYLSALPELYD
jgi:lactate dehydrogenase-like 2-hydroxyacid dehydrogenase